MRRVLDHPIIIIVLCSVLFFVFLGRLDLFSRDEAMYGEAARGMYAGGDWLTPTINGQPFYEKPPLYYWLSATSQHVLGATPLAARLPGALLAILTIFLVYLTGRRVWGQRAGLFAALALTLSMQFVLIGRMGIMDVPVTCLIVLALLAYEHWYRQGSLAAAAAFGACTALAVLMKGMAGLLAPAIMIVHLLVLWDRGKLRIAPAALALLICIAIAAPWFVVMSMRHGMEFVSVIFIGQQLNRMVTSMQGHSGPVYYYVGLVLISFFPWIVFVPAGVAAAFRSRQSEEVAVRFWNTLALVWIAVVLIPFSLIQTKLPGYITPLFPPMALLVGAELDRRLYRPGRAPWIGILAGSAVLGIVVSLLPFAGNSIRLDPALATHIKTALRTTLVPAVVWALGYVMIIVGAVTVIKRPQPGIVLLATGQTIALVVLIVGIMPVASVYLGGGEAQLTRIAQQRLPNNRLAIYEVYPEGVAFAAKKTVPSFEKRSHDELDTFLQQGDTALIVPLKKREQWSDLPAARTWDAGLYRLLAIPKQHKNNYRR